MRLPGDFPPEIVLRLRQDCIGGLERLRIVFGLRGDERIKPFA